MGYELFRVGHLTDPVARTGCSVILFDHAVPTVVDVRGGAPGTRETDLLGPGALVRAVDAILLTGGSAFGLGAAQGVMEHLAAQGRGVATAAGPIPIVPAAVIYDLAVGKATWPGPDDARAACLAAVEPSRVETGMVGAGSGATINKLAGAPLPGGFGMAARMVDEAAVWAMVVVNAAGAVGGPDSRPGLIDRPATLDERTSTTLVSVVVSAGVDDRTRRRCAVAAHDAIARRIIPCHTIWDGDVVFVSSEAGADVPPAELNRFAMATELAVEEAILSAIR